MRKAELRKENTEVREMYVVDLYEDGVLKETRELPNKSIYYAMDVVENWENGIIKLGGDTSEGRRSLATDP